MWERYEASGWQKTPNTISLSRKKASYAGSGSKTLQLLCIVIKCLFGNFQGCIGVNDRVWGRTCTSVSKYVDIRVRKSIK